MKKNKIKEERMNVNNLNSLKSHLAYNVSARFKYRCHYREDYFKIKNPYIILLHCKNKNVNNTVFGIRLQNR